MSREQAAVPGDEGRWRAVRSRDPYLDGAFVFAVRSTGIYCRPSCPARRPRRENVRFFPAAADAEASGYRACLRCRPREAGASRLAWIQEACRRLEAQDEGPLSLRQLAAETGLSPYHLHRAFKSVLGVTPREYADAHRLVLVKDRMKKGDSVTTALYEAGYGSSSRLYERAGPQLGMTPATYRKGGRGLRLGYAIAGSPLGRLLVAATPRGVCAVKLGDSDAALEAALREEYPAAELRRDEAALAPPLRAILRHLDGRQPRLDLPVDVRATAFQRRVWQELRRIPLGRTRSYGEIARILGRPTAARAVARACATNPVALVVPCHRVVPGAGGVGGYRWGAERKRKLLDRERAVAAEARSSAAGRRRPSARAAR